MFWPMFWPMFCWENLGSTVNANVTLMHTTNLNIFADQSTLLHGTTFTNGNGFFQQDDSPCCILTIVEEWFEEHSNEFKVLT